MLFCRSCPWGTKLGPAPAASVLDPSKGRAHPPHWYLLFGKYIPTIRTSEVPLCSVYKGCAALDKAQLFLLAVLPQVPLSWECSGLGLPAHVKNWFEHVGSKFSVCGVPFKLMVYQRSTSVPFNYIHKLSMNLLCVSDHLFRKDPSGMDNKGSILSVAHHHIWA